MARVVVARAGLARVVVASSVVGPSKTKDQA